MAKLSTEEKLAKIARQRKDALEKAKRLAEQEKALKLETKLKYLEELNPIALAAIDVFGDSIPRDREQAKAFFNRMGNQNNNNNDYQYRR